MLKEQRMNDLFSSEVKFMNQFIFQSPVLPASVTWGLSLIHKVWKIRQFSPMFSKDSAPINVMDIVILKITDKSAAAKFVSKCFFVINRLHECRKGYIELNQAYDHLLKHYNMEFPVYSDSKWVTKLDSDWRAPQLEHLVKTTCLEVAESTMELSRGHFQLLSKLFNFSMLVYDAIDAFRGDQEDILNKIESTKITSDFLSRVASDSNFLYGQLLENRPLVEYLLNISHSNQTFDEFMKIYRKSSKSGALKVAQTGIRDIIWSMASALGGTALLSEDFIPDTILAKREVEVIPSQAFNKADCCIRTSEAHTNSKSQFTSYESKILYEYSKKI